jgi:hypothetical protein
MKQGLKEDRSIDLGRLGKLRTAKLTRRRRVIRGLKNAGTSFFDYSKHAKTVKLKSKLDLSRDPLATIVYPAPAKPVYIKRPCAIGYPRGRRRSMWANPETVLDLTTFAIEFPHLSNNEP